MNNLGKWIALLRNDPIKALRSTGDPAIVFFANQLSDIKKILSPFARQFPTGISFSFLSDGQTLSVCWIALQRLV